MFFIVTSLFPRGAERRFLLQVWLQRISQQPRIVDGTTFQSFLLNAQKEVSAPLTLHAWGHVAEALGKGGRMARACGGCTVSRR